MSAILVDRFLGNMKRYVLKATSMRSVRFSGLSDAMNKSLMGVPVKAQRTSSFTLLGIFINTRFLQLPNDQFPIYSTPSGIVMLLSLVQLKNAKSSIS